MRFHSLTYFAIAALALAGGCGPGGPSSLEGFGDGDGDNETVGDGDGDGDTVGDGDGDGDNPCVIEGDIGSESYVYFEDWLSPGLGDHVPNHCGGQSIGDYAVTWKAPFSGPFRAVAYSDVSTSLVVLRGDCFGGLEGCSADGFPSIVDFEAVEGQQYTIAVDGAAESWFGLELFALDVMPGGCPTGALFDAHQSVSGSTVGAGSEFGSICGGGDSPDAEYLFFPPVTGIYQIDTFGSSFDTVLSVLQGECQWGTHLECNDDAFGTVQSSIETLLFADELYTIVVDGLGQQGAYQLNVSLVEDNPQVCEGIEPLPDQLPIFIGWSADATTGDAWHGCGIGSFERRFSWTPSVSGTYHAIQFAEGLFSSISLLDDCEGDGATCAAGGNAVELVFEAVAGKEVIIISEWEPIAPSEMSLLIDVLTPGCGENIGSEVPLMIADSTVGAGNEHSGSCSINPAPERELIWTPPANGTYRFTLEGSGYDTLLYIREGGCEGAELGCNDDTMTPFGLELWSTLELNLAAGQTVSIFVDGYDTGGDFVLTISQI